MNSRTAGVVVVSGLFSLVSCVAACSGASSSDLFGEPTTTESASPTDPTPASSGETASGGTSGTSGTSGTNGSSGSSGSSGTSGTSGTSGSSGSSGGTKDAGTDSATAWKSPGIYCGEDQGGDDVYCATGSKLCCARYSYGSGGGNRSFECVANGVQSCVGGQAIRCDDRSDCPSGEVCCGAFDQNQGYKGVQCAASCNTSPIPGLTPVRFCDPNAPVDECASISKTCTTSGSLLGFHVCK